MEKRRSFKGYIITCAIGFSVVVVILLVVMGVDLIQNKDVPIDMFSSIEECQQIEANKEDDATVTFLSTGDDKHLDGLTPLMSYNCHYTSDTMSFELFAYNFATMEDADAYFENVTGKSNNPAVTFLRSGGMSSYRCIAMDHEKVYCFICPNSCRNEVDVYVNNCFSETIVYESNA